MNLYLAYYIVKKAQLILGLIEKIFFIPPISNLGAQPTSNTPSCFEDQVNDQKGVFNKLIL
jgi:hypothetical protein